MEITKTLLVPTCHPKVEDGKALEGDLIRKDATLVDLDEDVQNKVKVVSFGRVGSVFIANAEQGEDLQE